MIISERIFKLHVFVVVFSLCLKPAALGFTSGSCIERERQALLEFKRGLIDDYDILSSWGSTEEKEDCCKWRGVRCSNRTGHVMVLDLHASLDFDLIYYRSLRGENKLSGKIPAWIGSHLTKMMILSLRLNEFSGSIPVNICHLNNIRILDLSQNNISGNIPWCIKNFTSLVQRDSHDKEIAILYLNFEVSLLHYLNSAMLHYVNSAMLRWKGQVSEYKSTLGLVRGIDLSCNKLVGKIPTEISSLAGLIFLNLSRNNLTGTIFQRIGQLNMLEILDLSKNQLFGEIPTGLACLNYLSVLDLSYNNLSGKIPSSTQLQSFDTASYIGNQELCGLPLPNKCPGDDTDAVDPSVDDHQKDNNIKEDEDSFLTPEFYISMGLGFGVGFGGVFGTLVLKNTWRYAYFMFLNNIKDWLYVRAAVNMARLLRRLQG